MAKHKLRKKEDIVQDIADAYAKAYALEQEAAVYRGKLYELKLELDNTIKQEVK